MSSAAEILLKECKRFKKELDELKFGAKSYKQALTIEENIIYLEQSNNIMDNKLKILKMENELNELLENPLPSSDTVSETKEKLLDKAIDDKIVGKMLKNITVSEGRIKLKNDSSDFKNKINDQLEYQKVLVSKIKEVSTKHQEVLQELIVLKKELRYLQDESKKKLKVLRKKVLADNEKLLGEEYKATILNTQHRIVKLNLMRVLTAQLLFNSQIDEDSMEPYQHIIENTRHPFSLEQFAEETK